MDNIEFIHFEEIDSTQTYAKQNVEKFKGKNIAIRADYQSHGRGQHDRKWESNKSKNIYVTYVLGFNQLQYISNIPLVTALVVLDTIKQYTTLQPQIKWPNDVFINDRKTCGILEESEFQDKLTLFIGIGVNIDKSPEYATNIESEYKQQIDDKEFYKSLSYRLIEYLQKLDTNGFQQFVEPLNQILYKRDQVCEFVHPKTDEVLYKGQLIGINDLGLLQIRQDDGLLITIQNDFALSQNHALVEKLPLLKVDANHPKNLISFMKGDPTEFGFKECQMTNAGYDIVRASISKSENHSYGPSCGTTQARQAILKHYDYNHNLTINDVIITAGVNQGLLYCLLGICDSGTNILVPEIGYPFFQNLAPTYGVQVRQYKLKSEKNWEIDIDSLNELIDEKTQFLFIINPSNPCGSVFSKNHIQEIINWAEDNKILLVADEVYHGMSFTDYTSFGQLANQGPIITLCGVEKILYVPGWQTAWMIFYDKNKLATQVKQCIQNLTQLWLHSNTFIMNSLDQLLDLVNNPAPLFKENHDKIINRINQIKGFKCIPAQGTIYVGVLVDLQFENDTEFALQLLKEENVQVMPLSWLGSDKYQGFRLLTIANHEIYEQLFERLAQFSMRYQKQ
ncbi:hypothetical protein pb186bvf_018929 [Paramecium bursaria]